MICRFVFYSEYEKTYAKCYSSFGETTVYDEKVTRKFRSQLKNIFPSVKFGKNYYDSHFTFKDISDRAYYEVWYCAKEMEVEI